MVNAFFVVLKLPQNAFLRHDSSLLPKIQPFVANSLLFTFLVFKNESGLVYTPYLSFFFAFLPFLMNFLKNMQKKTRIETKKHDLFINDRFLGRVNATHFPVF